MGSEQPRPTGKGKLLKGAVKFLPQLAQVSSKPQWQQASPLFHLRKEQKDDEPDQFMVRNELSPGEYLEERNKRRKIQDSDVSEPVAGTSTSKARSSHHPKKDRENFRSTLVNIIMQQDFNLEQPISVDETQPPRTGSPTPIEKDIVKYYYYIHHGIDTEHVAPMEDSWLEHILELVPQHLKVLSESICLLSDEMREDYLLSVKKSIVDFVLRDPREKEEDKKQAFLPPHRAEMEVVPKPWNKSFLSACSYIKDNLYAMNPTMLAVLDLWETSFNCCWPSWGSAKPAFSWLSPAPEGLWSSNLTR